MLPDSPLGVIPMNGWASRSMPAMGAQISQFEAWTFRFRASRLAD